MRRSLNVLLAAVALGVFFAGCGSGASEEELERARKQGAAKARQQAKIRQIEKELKELKKAGGTATSVASSGASQGSPSLLDCGDNLSVDPSTTSCEFATNVREAYYDEIGSGAGTVTGVWSPKRGRTYNMYCTDGSPHVCSGGNNARVVFP